MTKIQKLLQKMLQLTSIGIVSGFIYCGLEILWRGWTHWTMFILAFIVGIIISQYNNMFTYDMDLVWQVLFGGLTSIMLEYLFGITFNQDFTIWDYRGLWGTFAQNQLNILFCCAWFVIVCISIFILDWFEYKVLHDENKPYYVVFGHIFRPYGK